MNEREKELLKLINEATKYFEKVREDYKEIKEFLNRIEKLERDYEKLNRSLDNTVKYLTHLYDSIDESRVEKDQYIREKVERRKLRQALGIPD